MKVKRLLFLINTLIFFIPATLQAQERKVSVKFNFGIPSPILDKEYKNYFNGLYSIGLTNELKVFKFLTMGGYFEYDVLDDNISGLPIVNELIKNQIVTGGLIMGNDQMLKDKWILSNFVRLGYSSFVFKHREASKKDFKRIFKSGGRTIGVGTNLNFIMDNKKGIGLFFIYNFTDNIFDLKDIGASSLTTATVKTQIFQTGINVVIRL